MTTNNSVDSPLSGTTGTGNFVGSTSPTITTPNIVGVTNASSASAGNVGEFISSTITFASATSYSAGSTSNLTSIPLTAGDWDVFGNVGLSGTTITALSIGFSTTTGTLPAAEFRTYIDPLATSSLLMMPVPYQRINISSSTTLYCVLNAAGTGSIIMFGGIYARRVR